MEKTLGGDRVLILVCVEVSVGDMVIGLYSPFKYGS